ncbi:conserved hypothetical protein [Leishmania infantum JPCM5]|uniref:PUB_domain_containing_protein_-__putative n=2 Tax=Leishmania infantum TaxID=5671 RepID=A0A6L0WJ72_LEIIN|nr:conserved hypothetical protein [Leishmania infantum JPCM5]CAC9454851.1 PUB_domain_containing_protein_-__putative [Leishmania infantum]CAM65928.1 conserved hypothetical protein [Leishmania infantum JPCM5]SUZ39556.1 PUB_domain_containing_protein_-__putative [Leishmania infantum]|eukprot:XP_001463563.1 conserved hypothetical protein [Leishmania infantum JPCM5]
MNAVKLPEEWETLCSTSDAEVIHECINGVFRRLLANLLLDFNNPKFRQVKKDNKALRRLTESLPAGFIEFLFSSIGFAKHEDAFIFEGSLESLKHGDTVLSCIEDSFGKERLQAAQCGLYRLRNLAIKKAENGLTQREMATATARLQRARPLPQEEDAKRQAQHSGTEKDVAEEHAVKEAVRKTLLNTGRVRNGFFEARDFSVRTMQHGRVYACTKKCPDHCVEAHWHLFTGRNILYSHLAHLSADGTRLLHLGPEHGYQYNSLPGSANFGKMIHFSEKLMDENGRLVHIKNDDKPVTACIYCGRAFAELLL